MDLLFHDYHKAVEEGSGDHLAATISPISPPHYLNRLETIYNSTNYASVERDVGYGLTKTALGPINVASADHNLWIDIYVAYWKAVGEILAVQEVPTEIADWGKCYKSWKNLADTIIKGYNSGVLKAWTLPLLYTAGKHLRIFAIKADETAKGGQNGVDVGLGGIGEDIADDYGKNVNLEDAARVINRMFTLCISDRYVDRTSIQKFQPLFAVHFAEQSIIQSTN